MMHQVLYIVQLPNEEGDMHIIEHLVHHDMPCDPNLVSSAFYTIHISHSKLHSFTCNVLSVPIIISFSRSKGVNGKLYANALDRKKTCSHAKFQCSIAMIIELCFFMKKKMKKVNL